MNPAGSGTARLTVLGTTDTHGHVLNWDYYGDRPYSDHGGNEVGLAKIATLIKQVRAQREPGTTLTLDAGDTIQGTPLAYHAARITPAGSGPHPMAAAMNAIGYDAAALGNHEFNYGLDVLRRFQAELGHPLLGANARDWTSGEPAFEEFTLVRVPVPGSEEAVTVGIVGLVTPGCAIWDKAEVQGRVRFTGIVEQAAEVVPRVKRAGADVVVVACHSGATTSSSYGDALPWPENASTLLAEQVPDIDAILVGHAHVEIAQRFVTNAVTGREVLLSEPLKWGMRLTVMDLDLRRAGARWHVSAARASLLDANTAAEDAEIADLVRAAHERTRGYVNSVIGSCTRAMSAARSRYEDTAALAFVTHVTAAAAKRALAGTSSAALPVLAAAAPFSATAGIPAGPVSVRDIAGLYPFDNTVQAVLVTGAQVREYLEFAARYFRQVDGPGPFTPRQITRAVTPLAPGGTPDYNYDVLAGLDAPLTYDIDIAEPPGRRIATLRHAGEPVTDEQQFVLAANNYRAAGGGNYPVVSTAPVVHSGTDEIRQLVIDAVTSAGVLDPATYSHTHWKLVARGVPVTVEG